MSSHLFWTDQSYAAPLHPFKVVHSQLLFCFGTEANHEADSIRVLIRQGVLQVSDKPV